MAKYHVELDVVLDDAAMLIHDGDNVAPPNEVEDWNFHDFCAALDKSLVDFDESEVGDIVACES